MRTERIWQLVHALELHLIREGVSSVCTPRASILSSEFQVSPTDRGVNTRNWCRRIAWQKSWLSDFFEFVKKFYFKFKLKMTFTEVDGTKSRKKKRCRASNLGLRYWIGLLPSSVQSCKTKFRITVPERVFEFVFLSSPLSCRATKFRIIVPVASFGRNFDLHRCINEIDSRKIINWDFLAGCCQQTPTAYQFTIPQNPLNRRWRTQILFASFQSFEAFHGNLKDSDPQPSYQILRLQGMRQSIPGDCLLRRGSGEGDRLMCPESFIFLIGPIPYPAHLSFE